MASLNSTSLLYRRLLNRQGDISSTKTSTVTGTTGTTGIGTTWTVHLGSLRPPDSAAMDPALPPWQRQDDPWRDALRFAMAISPATFNAVQPAATAGGAPTSLSEVGLGIYTCAPASALNISITVDYAGATTLWDASFWWYALRCGVHCVADPHHVQRKCASIDGRVVYTCWVLDREFRLRSHSNSYSHIAIAIAIAVPAAVANKGLTLVSSCPRLRMPLFLGRPTWADKSRQRAASLPQPRSSTGSKHPQPTLHRISGR